MRESQRTASSARAPKGVEWFGSKRLKAPEEYVEGSTIDERTNVFTLGALIFEFFGTFSDEEIRRRYRDSRFVPCALPDWQLNEECYRVASEAVNSNKSDRYAALAEFYAEWKRATGLMPPAQADNA